MPNGSSAETAALVEPLAFARLALRLSGLADGATALVIGGGPNGLGTDLMLDPTQEALIAATHDERPTPGGLISGRVALEDAPEKGCTELADNVGGHIKILVHP